MQVSPHEVTLSSRSRKPHTTGLITAPPERPTRTTVQPQHTQHIMVPALAPALSCLRLTPPRAAAARFRNSLPPRPPSTRRLTPLPCSYPPHVWSPSGGWYCQPHNWRMNTAVMAVVIAGFTAMAWKASANLEERTKMPDPDRVFPSRSEFSWPGTGGGGGMGGELMGCG